MARRRSIAKAGYFPLPLELIPALARLLEPRDPDAVGGGGGGSPSRGFGLRRRLVLIDPCAGDGAAVSSLARLIQPSDVLVAELEQGRAEALAATKFHAEHWGGAALYVTEGDALTIPPASTASGHILYLNPPYDLDPVLGRLEARWLQRFEAWIVPGGVLLAVVPYQALAAMAPILRGAWGDIRVWRVPDPIYATFRQVVVGATRRSAGLGDAAWIVPPEASLPILGETGGERPYPVRRTDHNPYFYGVWHTAGLDTAGAVSEYRFGHGTGRKGRLLPYEPIWPVGGLESLRGRVYRLATRPRPGHLAAAIVCGVFDGEQVRPVEGRSLPSLYIKGTFARRFREVERRYSENGEAVASVQVQYPSLRISVLDPERGKVVELGRSTDPSEEADIGRWTVGDLLLHYGPDLLRLLQERCPLRFDPNASLPGLARTKRALFPAQREIVAAASQALAAGESFLIQGQTGTGKTTMAAATLAGIGARRAVVVAPPHLVAETWPRELSAMFGDDVLVVPLRTPADVRGLAALRDDPRLVVGVVSREAAKLGHAIVGVGPICPACGARSFEPGAPARDVQARRRLRCSAPVLTRRPGPLGRAVINFASALAADGLYPGVTRQIVRAVSPRRAAAEGDAAGTQVAASATGPVAAGLSAAAIACLPSLVEEVAAAARRPRKKGLAAAWIEASLRLLVWAGPCIEGDLVRRTGFGGVGVAAPAADSASSRRAARPALALFAAFVRTLLAVPSVGRDDAWRTAAAAIERWAPRMNPGPGAGRVDGAVWRELVDEVAGDAAEARYYPHLRVRGVEGAEVAAEPTLADVLEDLGRVDLGTTRVCGSPLYTAHVWPPLVPAGAAEPERGPDAPPGPAPRRVPLARVVADVATAAGLDLLIVDEAHEYNSADSAQGQAVRTMATAIGRSLYLTGSVNNGFADALFEVVRALSPDFRARYKAREHADFQAAYGYVTRRVDLRGQGAEASGAGADATPLERSSAGSARVVRGGVRVTGKAPGVLPVAVLRWLLPHAGTLDLESVAAHLPPKTFETIEVEPTRDVAARARYLLDETMRAIRAARRDRERAGRLFGALARLPGYFDLAAAVAPVAASGGGGPNLDGEAVAHGPASFEVRWPEELGAGLVAAVPLEPPGTILPKVRALADRIRCEVAEGRRCLVLAWHVELVESLAQTLRNVLGSEVDAKGNHVAGSGPWVQALPRSVAARKREAWIDGLQRKRGGIVGAGPDVLIAQPKAVETGLNNLVVYPTQLWAENPAANAYIFRQVVGRAHRIGQTEPVRIVFFDYAATSTSAADLVRAGGSALSLQPIARSLLLHKVGVSEAVDGLDASGALLAAGVDDGGGVAASLSVGKALYALLER